MTLFINLLADSNKLEALGSSVRNFRVDRGDQRIFLSSPDTFHDLPGTSFAYWVGSSVRAAFKRFPAFESELTGLLAKRGVNSNDDFRFIRLWWEPSSSCNRWVVHPKGGKYHPFYSELSLVIDWHPNGRHLEAERVTDRVYSHAIIPSRELYFRAGLTWALRTKSRLSMRVMPKGCVFGSKGPAVIAPGDDENTLLSALALCSSAAYYAFVEVQLAAADAKPGGAAHSFEVGVIQNTPLPPLGAATRETLASLARRAWSLNRTLDTTDEVSHAFSLPAALCASLGDYDPQAIELELARIQAEIEVIAFDLYGFSDADRAKVHGGQFAANEGDADSSADDEDDDEDGAPSIDQTAGLLTWAIGVAFGRFDIRIATGERATPPEPEPFDPLPAKSPGMLPDGDAPFHPNAGILVDDPGHEHDLVRIAEHVLERVDMPVPADLRRWLLKDFFPFHLQRYSKSRRKAPIYWPLSTASGSYTLWLYYPSLTSQTLYTAINDFVEPKLVDVVKEAAGLKAKRSARNREEERRLEALTTLEAELTDLRDQLQAIAPRYLPNHDDGVQITAAPLWPLFRHKPWQKVLKDTWAKLQKGDYDWAHLAMNYWPERVREKCKTDKSLAIAHGLEDVYVEPEAAPKKTRGRTKKEDAE